MAADFDISGLSESERVELLTLLSPGPEPVPPPGMQNSALDFAAFADEAEREAAAHAADPSSFRAQAKAHCAARWRHLERLLSERDKEIGWRLPIGAPEFLALWFRAGELAAADGWPEPIAEPSPDPAPEPAPAELMN